MRLVKMKNGDHHGHHFFTLSKECILIRNLRSVFPDTHLLGLLNEIVSEVRVGDVDEQFRSLPGVLTLQVCDAVFCNNEVGRGSRSGYDTAFRKHRADQ